MFRLRVDGEGKPSGYSFLAEIEATTVDQVSIKTAQSSRCAILARVPSKHIVLGVIDLQDMTVETPATVAERIRRALPYVPPERIVVAPDCGIKYCRGTSHWKSRRWSTAQRSCSTRA